MRNVEKKRKEREWKITLPGYNMTNDETRSYWIFKWNKIVFDSRFLIERNCTLLDKIMTNVTLRTLKSIPFDLYLFRSFVDKNQKEERENNKK